MSKVKTRPVRGGAISPTPARSAVGYVPRTASDYETDVKRRQKVGSHISKEAKMQAFANNILSPGGGIKMEGWRKLGQQFVGPILLRLKYEGIARDVILERPLPQGKAPLFPVKTDIGKAYVLQGNMGELRIHRVEGKLVQVPLFRVGSRPMVPKSDVMRMDFDLIGMVKEDATLQILEEEDKRLLTLLSNAVTNWSTLNSNSTAHQINQVGTTYWVQSTFHSAFTQIARKRLKPATLLLEAGDYYSFFEWGVDKIGWKAKEELVSNGVLASYGDVNIKTCVNVPAGQGYAMPEAKYVGFMPISWSLDSTPLDHPEDAELGFVFDEEVGMLVANVQGAISMNIT
ncbi:MAG: hypothetical protein JRN22_01915 [Nitrososphaerota archaeon]|nr:hypothetical protein [Nitrososphaerota archaeon]